jgi:hypothetical protein
MKNKTKRGELTTQQLVMIIILILSFAIILFFIFRLGLGKTTDREICHDSVVKKSNLVLGKLSGEFNCKTTSTCISAGGQCSDITAEATVNVNANNKDEIFKAIAEEMANCWWMFGEGKLNYEAGCAVCSEIAFDDKIKSTYPEGISHKEFLDSLTKPMNVQKNNDNYLYYLYEVSSLNSVFEKDSKFKIDYDKKTNFTLKGKFIIMTGIFKGKPLETFSHFIQGQSNNNYIIPYFPTTVEESPKECNQNFLTKRT